MKSFFITTETIMTEKPILYLNILSPGCRSVLMTGAELGVEFDWKVIDMLGLEHKNQDFVEVSSIHSMNFMLLLYCSNLYLAIKIN